jgi:di/tricarboxylate transporter
MIALIIITALMLAIAVLICTSKFDWLMAGYKEMSKKERERYNMLRVRSLIVITLVVIAVILWIPVLIGHDDNIHAILLSSAAILVVTVMSLILVNTWCKKH